MPRKKVINHELDEQDLYHSQDIENQASRSVRTSAFSIKGKLYSRYNSIVESFETRILNDICRFLDQEIERDKAAYPHLKFIKAYYDIDERLIDEEDEDEDESYHSKTTELNLCIQEDLQKWLLTNPENIHHLTAEELKAFQSTYAKRMFDTICLSCKIPGSYSKTVRVTLLHVWLAATDKKPENQELSQYDVYIRVKKVMTALAHGFRGNNMNNDQHKDDQRTSSSKVCYDGVENLILESLEGLHPSFGFIFRESKYTLSNTVLMLLQSSISSLEPDEQRQLYFYINDIYENLQIPKLKKFPIDSFYQFVSKRIPPQVIREFNITSQGGLLSDKDLEYLREITHPTHLQEYTPKVSQDIVKEAEEHIRRRFKRKREEEESSGADVESAAESKTPRRRKKPLRVT